jgi:flagellar biogenesis protein FliO
MRSNWNNRLAMFSFALCCAACTAGAAPTTRPMARSAESVSAPVARAALPLGPAVPGKFEDQQVRAAVSKTSSASLLPTSQPAIATDAPSALDYRRVGLALAIVIGLIFVMRWAGRKFFPTAAIARSGGAMKVMSRLVISPKQQLLMIQVGRRIVVVGDSAGQMAPVSEITDPEEIASLMGQLAEEKSQYSLKGFGTLFNRAGGRFDESPAQMQRDSALSDSPPEIDDESPQIDDARGEISGLMEKIKLLSSQFRRQT